MEEVVLDAGGGRRRLDPDRRLGIVQRRCSADASSGLKWSAIRVTTDCFCSTEPESSTSQNGATVLSRLGLRRATRSGRRALGRGRRGRAGRDARTIPRRISRSGWAESIAPAPSAAQPTTPNGPENAERHDIERHAALESRATSGAMAGCRGADSRSMASTSSVMAAPKDRAVKHEGDLAAPEPPISSSRRDRRYSGSL